MKKSFGVLFTLVLLVLPACGGEEPSDEPTDVPTMESPTAEAAGVSFTSPESGATVSSPVQVKMAAEGVTIEPASAGVKPNSGHLHVMIDTDCLQAGQTIPNDASHMHLGMGQTEAELQLSPGEHNLCLQLGDANHVATDLTDQISITVAG